MRTTFRILHFVIILISVGACSSESESIPIIDFDTHEIHLSDEKSSAKLEFSASDEWTASSSADWLQIIQKEGLPGSCAINFIALENEQYVERSAQIIVECKSIRKEFSIYQDANSKPLINLSEINLCAEESDTIIPFCTKSNVETIVNILGESWLSVLEYNSALYSGVKVHVLYNKSVEQRFSELYFKCGIRIDTLKICQNGVEPYILIEKDDYEVGYEEQQLEVKIESNFEYEVDTQGIDWISYKMNGNGLALNLYQNSTSKPRFCKIYLRYKDICKIITISQTGMPTELTGSGSGFTIQNN